MHNKIAAAGGANAPAGGEAAAPAETICGQAQMAPIRSGAAAAKPIAKERLLRGLRASARAGDPCPSNAELAAYLGPRVSATLAGHLLRGLEIDGVIVIIRRGQTRIVEAADGSWATAEPESDAPPAETISATTRAGVREATLSMLRRGLKVADVARMSGIPEHTIRAWKAGVQPQGLW